MKLLMILDIKWYYVVTLHFASRTKIYYIQSLWFDPTRVWTHNLPHTKSLVWHDQSSNTQSTTYKVFGLTRPGLEHTIYHIQSLWFDTTRARTHNLPHTKSLVWPDQIIIWGLQTMVDRHEIPSDHNKTNELKSNYIFFCIWFC